VPYLALVTLAESFMPLNSLMQQGSDRIKRLSQAKKALEKEIAEKQRILEVFKKVTFVFAEYEWLKGVSQL